MLQSEHFKIILANYWIIVFSILPSNVLSKPIAQLVKNENKWIVKFPWHTLPSRMEHQQIILSYSVMLHHSMDLDVYILYSNISPLTNILKTDTCGLSVLCIFRSGSRMGIMLYLNWCNLSIHILAYIKINCFKYFIYMTIVLKVTLLISHNFMKNWRKYP